MSDYRRVYVANGAYFFTLVTYKRRRIFAAPNNVNLLRECIRHVQESRPFGVVAIVVLQDHLRCIWRFAAADGIIRHAGK